jgi:hypothetical protein
MEDIVWPTHGSGEIDACGECPARVARVMPEEACSTRLAPDVSLDASLLHVATRARVAEVASQRVAQSAPATKTGPRAAARAHRPTENGTRSGDVLGSGGATDIVTRYVMGKDVHKTNARRRGGYSGRRDRDRPRSPGSREPLPALRRRG